MSENIYMYDPKLNITTEVTMEYLTKLTGFYPRQIRRKIAERSIVGSLDCYLLNKPLTVQEKRKMIFELKIEDEIWRESKYKGLFVSNKGRFRDIHKGQYRYRLLVRKHQSFFTKYKSKEIKCRRLVYETFKGEIPKNMTVECINDFCNDINADNLRLIELGKMKVKLASKAGRKAVVHIDQQGKLIDEYVSAVEAANNLYVSDDTVRNACNNTTETFVALGYRAFMWADEYFGGGVNGIA